MLVYQRVNNGDFPSFFLQDLPAPWDIKTLRPFRRTPWLPHHGIGGFGAQGQRRIRHGAAANGNGLDDWTPKTDGKMSWKIMKNHGKNPNHGKMSGKIHGRSKICVVFSVLLMNIVIVSK